MAKKREKSPVIGSIDLPASTGVKLDRPARIVDIRLGRINEGDIRHD